jgi:hypothetical protein
MRQSVRALGWAITLSMLLTFAFLVTAIYSMVQTMIESRGIGIGEVRAEFSDGRLTLSIPLTINNTGYYDISNFNVTLLLKGPDGTVISSQSTLLERVERGSTATSWSNLTIDMAELLSDMEYLLFNDSEFKLDMLLSFRYAYALTFQVSAANISIPWGAPLYNFSITGVGVPYNISLTECLIDVYFGFENHSPFSVEGTLRLEIYNDGGEYLGSGVQTINVPPRQGFSGYVTVHIENLLKYTGSGYIKVSFESPVLGLLDLGRVYYG